MCKKSTKNGQAVTDQAESLYLKLSTHHPYYTQLTAIAEANGTTWQDEARQALAFYCTLHRSANSILTIAKS